MDKKFLYALRTLRGIRQRYDTERSADSDSGHAYTMHVALGSGDMHWLTAAIEALEKAISTGVDEIEIENTKPGLAPGSGVVGRMDIRRRASFPRVSSTPR